MSERPARQNGISLLAMVEIVGGMIAVIIGGLAWVAPISDTPGAFFLSFAIFGLFAPLFGFLAIGAGYGLWSGKAWGWTWSVGLAAVGTGSVTLNSLLFFRPDPAYYFLLVVMFTGILVGGLVLYYLSRPHVKAYFGK